MQRIPYSAETIRMDTKTDVPIASYSETIKTLYSWLACAILRYGLNCVQYTVESKSPWPVVQQFKNLQMQIFANHPDKPQNVYTVHKS